MSEALSRPDDYQARLSGGRAATPADVVASRADWEDTQKWDLQRGKTAVRQPSETPVHPE
jgi:hypothetical protein